MNNLSVLTLLASLFVTQQASAQFVTVNLVPTRPGHHDVRAGSSVYVYNNTDKPVTITIPYRPEPIILQPRESHRFTADPNPGGSTSIDGANGSWRLNPV